MLCGILCIHGEATTGREEWRGGHNRRRGARGRHVDVVVVVVGVVWCGVVLGADVMLVFPYHSVVGAAVGAIVDFVSLLRAKMRDGCDVRVVRTPYSIQ